MDAHLQALRSESERFLEVLAPVPPATPVPSCDGWSRADLVWHLGEVQHTWARIVADGLTGDDVDTPERPADDDLAAFAARAGTELLGALGGRDPAGPAWSWDPGGGTVAWVARRQAHEALVHRVDAELTAGVPVRPPSVALAVDGVDEVLTVFVDGVPGWGRFAPDGVRVALRCTNDAAAWLLELGRFVGTSPTSGTAYDLDAATVRRGGREEAADLVVAGHAWDLDLWLWGRAGADRLEVTGPDDVLARVRALVAEATQ